MRLPTPPWPSLPPAQQTRHPVPLRYEDLSQDGRLMVATLGPLYGAVAWKEMLQHAPMAAVAREQGVVPILTRLVLDGGVGPFSPALPLEVEAGYALAHSLDERGELARLHLEIWADARGPRGHAHDLIAAPGPEQQAGRVYAEHVFTRLFAPPGERKVLRLDLPDLPPVPPRRIEPVSAEVMLSLPEDAEPLDGPTVDPILALFSLGHTDSNQHVNSLVYPRLFEDAALRKLRSCGVTTALLTRHADCLYRKPFFAGEAAWVKLQVFAQGDSFGAVGAFFPEKEGPEGRPGVLVRLRFER